MLWRQPYTQRVVRDLPLPKHRVRYLDDGSSQVFPVKYVLIGAFGLQSIADIGIWERLSAEAFPSDNRIFRGYIRKIWTPKDVKETTAMIAPSAQNQTLLIADAEDEWSKIVQPDSIERGFAAIISEGKIILLMVGPPTEETWDDFRIEWGKC
jgi:hypothetical protein